MIVASVKQGFFIALTCAALGGTAGAQPAAVAGGKDLAVKMCQQCHVIVPSNGAGWTDAPSFESIANRSGQTAAALSATIQKPHLHMLNDQRPKPEADLLAAYIISLRKN